MSQLSSSRGRGVGFASLRSRQQFRKRIPAILALFAMLWYSAVPAGAGTNIWSNGSNDSSWDTTTNWSLNAKPVQTDDVLLPTPIPNNGSLIVLSNGEKANSLTIRDAY